MTDPDIQAAVDRAITELTRRLRPWAVGMADPHAFAAAYVNDYLRAEGWRPPLRPPPDWTSHRRPAPEAAADTARRGAELARRALTTREDTTGHA